MAQTKSSGASAQKLQTLSTYVQSLGEAIGEQDGVTIGDILGSRVDRVRLYQGDNHKRTMVREVSLTKDEQAKARAQTRVMQLLAKRSRGRKPIDQGLVSIIEEISDPEISVDLTMDMKSGAVSLAVEMEPVLEGQDLSLLMKGTTNEATPVFDDEPFGDEYWSAEEAAENLGVAKSTITRRIKNNELIGFKLFKNALYVPREQIEEKTLIGGILKVLEMFQFDHREAWRFLSSTLFYGEDESRPIDRLRSAKNAEELELHLSEIQSAKSGFDHGDHT